MGIASKLREERLYLRYMISGCLSLYANGRRWVGIPLNISMGGILFQTEARLSSSVRGTIRLEVFGFSDTIVADVRIVRTQGANTAAVFLTPPSELERLISLLAA
jgi:hypothetical protein